MRRKQSSSRSAARSQHGTLFYQKPLSAMTTEEGVRWLQGMRERLANKQHRERAYLDRRAARGTYTPVDEAYEQDQILESELLALLDGLIEQMLRDSTTP